jgi:hypothetical protein
MDLPVSHIPPLSPRLSRLWLANAAYIIYVIHKIEVWEEGRKVRRILNETMTYPLMHLRRRTSDE